MDTRRLARRRLDERLNAYRGAGRMPPNGWIKAIRESLGMTTAQLANRLGIRQPSVVDLERGEAGGKVTIASLKRAAEALDCTLVYALVPNATLEDTVTRASRSAAEKELETTLYTMGLENQAPRVRDRKEMLERTAKEIAEAGGQRLWGSSRA